MKISNLDLEIMNDCVFSCHYSNWEPCANSVIKSDLVQYCFGFRDFKWKEIASCSVFLRGVDYLWRFFFFSFFLLLSLSLSLLCSLFTFRFFYFPFPSLIPFHPPHALITHLPLIRTLFLIIHIAIHSSSALPIFRHRWQKTTLWYWQFIERYSFITIANSSVIAMRKFYGLMLLLFKFFSG